MFLGINMFWALLRLIQKTIGSHLKFIKRHEKQTEIIRHYSSKLPCFLVSKSPPDPRPDREATPVSGRTTRPFPSGNTKRNYISNTLNNSQFILSPGMYSTLFLIFISCGKLPLQNYHKTF